MPGIRLINARGGVAEFELEATGGTGLEAGEPEDPTDGGFLIIREPVAPVNRSVTPTEPRNIRVAFFCQSNLGGSASAVEAGEAGEDSLPSPSCDI